MNRILRERDLFGNLGKRRAVPTSKKSSKKRPGRKFELGDAVRVDPKKDKYGKRRKLYGLAGIVIGYGGVGGPAPKGSYYVSFPEINKEYKISSAMLVTTGAQGIGIPEVIE